MNEDDVLKRCPYCSKCFAMTDVLHDNNVKPIGMAFGKRNTEKAYYFFQHEAPGCGTSLLIDVQEFSDLIQEKIPTQKLTLGECCEEHCVNIKDLSECNQECYFAPFRRFLLRMLRSKSATESATVKQR